MKRVKRALKTRRGIGVLSMVAILVVVMASAAVINSLAAPRVLFYPANAGSTQLSYITLDNTTNTTTDISTVGQDAFSYQTQDFDTDAERYILWNLTYKEDKYTERDIVSFDAGTTLKVSKGATSPAAATDSDAVRPLLYARHAGVAKLMATPRTNYDGGFVAGNPSSIDVIVPLIAANETQKKGQDTTLSLDNIIDPTANAYLKFNTNATYDNLTIKIDGIEQDIKYVSTEDDIGNKDSITEIYYAGSTHRVYIPTTIYSAGNHSVMFETKDVDFCTSDGYLSDKQAKLRVSYTVKISPSYVGNTDKFTTVNSLSSATVTKGGWYKMLNSSGTYDYYYIFSEEDLQSGNDTADLFSVTNLTAQSIGLTIDYENIDPYDSNVCDINTSTGIITAKQAGVTCIYASGSSISGTGRPTVGQSIELTVIVPFTNVGAVLDPIKMNVGDKYEIKTTGGTQQTDPTFTTTNNGYIKLGQDDTTKQWYATAMKATDTVNPSVTVTVVINKDKYYKDTSYTQPNDVGQLLIDLYGADAFAKIDYHFVVIDGFSLNTDYVTIGTTEGTVSSKDDVNVATVVANLTNTETNADGTLKYPVTWTISDRLDSNGKPIDEQATVYHCGTDEATDAKYGNYYKDVTKLSGNSGTVTAYFIGTGESLGYQVITASQTIDGVIKSAQCIIEVTKSLESFYLDPTEVVLYKDASSRGQQMFTARYTPKTADDKTIKEWFASDDSIISIEPGEDGSDTATVTALKGGVVYLYATTTGGKRSEPAKITVKSIIDGITVTPSKQDCTTGEKVQLVTKVSHADGNTYDDEVKYYSSDTSVATVDENTGLVTCLKPGVAVITCRAMDDFSIQQAYCTLTIETPVDTLTLSESQVSLSVGEMHAIKGIITPGNATNQVVTWTVDDESVAKIEYAENSTDSLNATITAVSPGWAFITCQTGNGIVATCRVQVKQPIEEITLNESEMTVRKGTVFWMNATYTPLNADDHTITWSSSDESICTVDTSGKVTAVAVGQAYITASNTESAKFARCLVTVIQSVDSLTLNANSVTLTIDPNYNIEPIMTSFGLVATVSPSDADNKRCTFVSTNPEIASVDVSEDGRTAIITAVKGGSTAVTVTTEDGGLVQTCTVTVMEYVTSIDITDDEKYVSIGKNAKLTATVLAKSATNKNIIWTSSNDDVCYVDQTGIIHGISEGYAVITATAADGSGVADTCLVQVVNPAVSMTIDPSSVHLLYGSSYGDSAVLKAVIEPADATIQDVTWSSSNEAIATVDEGGEVFAMGVGNCTITATAADGSGVKATCKVRVTAAKSITSMKLNSKDIYMLVGKQRQLAVTVRPVSYTDSYDWYSTDTGIVTVNGSGLITTVGAGTADVVVESTDNGVSSTCTVHALGISRSTLRLEQYDSNDLDVLGIDSGDTVTWRSSNTRIATVDSSGHVVGRMSGTCTITAKTHDKTLTCTVTVFTAKKYN